jgi:hypothetical protein
LFIICINDLPWRINFVLEPVLFADDSVIISCRKFGNFRAVSDLVVCHMIEWFLANNLVQNVEKTNVLKFITNNSPYYTLCIGYKTKYVEETANTKFLGLQINNHLTQKNHVAQMIPKLSAANCAFKSLFHVSKVTIFRSIYFAYFHPDIKHGITFLE